TGGSAELAAFKLILAFPGDVCHYHRQHLLVNVNCCDSIRHYASPGRSGEHAKRYSQAGSRGYRRSRQGDERRPIIRAEAHMLQGQTESRSRILHCPADLIAPAIAMMPVFYELSRAEGPSQQSRKTPAGSGLRTRGKTGLAANFRQNAPEIHASLVSPRPRPAALIPQIETLNWTDSESGSYTRSSGKGECVPAMETKSQVELLHEISNIVSSNLSLEKMLQELIGLAVEVTECDACLVYLVDKSRKEIVLRASQLPHAREIGHIKLKMGEGITGWVAQNKSVVALGANAA